MGGIRKGLGGEKKLSQVQGKRGVKIKLAVKEINIQMVERRISRGCVQKVQR